MAGAQVQLVAHKLTAELEAAGREEARSVSVAKKEVRAPVEVGDGDRRAGAGGGRQRPEGPLVARCSMDGRGWGCAAECE